MLASLFADAAFPVTVAAVWDPDHARGPRKVPPLELVTATERRPAPPMGAKLGATWWGALLRSALRIWILRPKVPVHVTDLNRVSTARSWYATSDLPSSVAIRSSLSYSSDVNASPGSSSAWFEWASASAR